MPKINLKKSKTVNKKAASDKQDDTTLTQSKSPNPWSSPWGDDFGDLMNEFSKPTTTSKRMSPQERIAMIEKVFEEVLNRKPDTRDLNYYKYSTLSENEIRKQLLAGKEHQKLIEEGREYKKMKERAQQAETRVKMLEAQNQDQIEEFKQLGNLLKEKNNYIQKLRDDLKNPYNMNPPAQIVQPTQTLGASTIPQATFTSPVNSEIKPTKISKSTLLERIAEVLIP